MSVMNTPKYSSALMMKHGPLNYSTDVSILQHATPGQPTFGPIEGTDRNGFLLVSAKSGREMRVELVQTNHNADNEITHWTLESNAEDAKRLSTPILLFTVWNT